MFTRTGTKYPNVAFIDPSWPREATDKTGSIKKKKGEEEAIACDALGHGGREGRRGKQTREEGESVRRPKGSIEADSELTRVWDGE